MKVNAFTVCYADGFRLTAPELSLEKGKCCAVIGANGSGKSTFARALAGVIPVEGKKPPIENVGIGYMPQKSYPFRLSAAANLRLAGNNPEREKMLLEALGLDKLARRKMNRLSGGESAKLALARVLMGNHDLLILDEPTAAMDMEATLQAERLIKDYCRAGSAVLLVTHNIRQAERLADEVMFFSGGELLERGEAEQLLHGPEQPETKRFLDFCGYV